MKKFSIFFLAFASVLQICIETKANFVVRIGDGTPLVFAAGDSAVIPVFAYSVGVQVGDNRVLNDYNLAFDFFPSGVGLGADFSNFSFDFTGGFGDPGSQTWELDAFADNYDFLVAAGQLTGVNLGNHPVGTPLKLFDFKFDVDSLAQGGIYSFGLREDALSFGGDVNFLDGTGVNSFLILADGGAFEITGTPIPEPTSLLLVASAGGAVAYRLRRRRRQTAVVEAN